MNLYYDRTNNMFWLDIGDQTIPFLGPTHAVISLRNYGLTESQAREAVLQAVFNTGAAVDLSIIKKIAKESSYYTKVA